MKNFTKNLNRTVNQFGFKCKKHAPELLIVTGIIGVVGSAIMACKATPKAIEAKQKSAEEADNLERSIVGCDLTEQSVTQYKHEVSTIRRNTVLKYVQLYAPSVILGAASIGCIVESHNILSKRNVAIAAAYATVDKGFKEYRGRVIDRFGKDIDDELRFNVKSKEVENTTVDEDGNPVTTNETVKTADPNEYSTYARFFDESCKGWTKSPETNLIILRQQQNYANEKLKHRGYLFLNEVYDMLGIDRVKAGQIVGWYYDETNPSGDNFVDFGVYNQERSEDCNERVRAFVNGKEKNILLDFNVDGDILNRF